MATQKLLKIVYALDIKFWVRWCTCSMWRMLLPYGKLIRSVVVLSPLSHYIWYIKYFQGLSSLAL